MSALDFWKQRLTVPAYRLGEAATYVRISAQTIANWELQKNSKTPVVSGRLSRAGLSFLQLIEVAVVAAMRKQGVKLPDIRAARSYITAQTGMAHPFAQLKFKSDGVDILLHYEGVAADVIKDKLLLANRGGQLIWTVALSDRLREFDYGQDGNVQLWKVNGVNSNIEISPKIAFGAPAIGGIATAAIKQRWADGYSIEDISDDLELEEVAVEEALRFEKMNLNRERKSHWVN